MKYISWILTLFSLSDGMSDSVPKYRMSDSVELNLGYVGTAMTTREHRRSFEWWRHQMKAFSALLALCEGNPPVTDGFPSRRPVTRSFDVFFDLRLNKLLSKASIETPVIWGAIVPIMTHQSLIPHNSLYMLEKVA